MQNAASEPLVTLYYQVSAVNAVGEGPRSNEVAVTVPASLAYFTDFVADMQAATYYGKWTRDNPGEANRWYAFRDLVLGGADQPSPPTMLTKYGKALIDAARSGSVKG